MDESQIERDSQLKRHERLQYLYGLLVQLVMHEGRFVSERTNIWLLFNSILFTGFLVLLTQQYNINIWINALKAALPAVGLAMSVLHFISIVRTMHTNSFWVSSIRLIEEDPDFWCPVKTERDNDLDIFIARRKYLDGVQTRQQYVPRSDQLPDFVDKLAYYLPDPNRIFVYYFPALISILWLLALVAI